MWACKCDCGNTCIVAGSSLRRGHTQSCGCYHRERAGAANVTHGMYSTRLYRIWQHMKARCGDLSGKHYPNYGDRGIEVCTEWINSFELFCEWALANGYSESLTIDRIDPNGNYEPSNCRWLTMKGQGNNKRNNVYVTINGKTQTMMQWSEELHIRYRTVRYRISKMKMSPYDALTRPLKGATGENKTGHAIHAVRGVPGTGE